MIRNAPRRTLPALIVLLALGVAACSSAASITPLPSDEEPPANCPRVEDGVIDFSAEDLEFSAPCMVAIAGEAFTIHFTNNDTQPHNVAAYTDSGRANEIMKGEVISAQGQSLDYEVPAQNEGQYYFDCTIHAEMNGTLYVVAAGV